MKNHNNVWLKRAADKKTQKFRGKFQEAGKANINKRIYPSFSKADMVVGAQYREHVNKEPTLPPQQVQAHHSVPAQQTKSVEERWQPISHDECGWFPIRPGSAPKIDEINLDLSAEKVGNDRYKAYQRQQLVDDALFIYGGENKTLQEKKLEDLKLQVQAQNPMYLGVPVESIMGQGLFVQEGTVTISSLPDNMGSVTISSGAVSANAITITGICP